MQAEHSEKTQAAKILVVDDDPSFLFGVSRILTRAEFNVLTASDGLIGITKAQIEQPDLILLDINMPKLNGFEVKKVLEKSSATQSIPVVFLSALNDRNNIVSGLNIAEDYINKPVDAEILIARIRAVLRRLAVGYKMAVSDSKNPMFSADQFQQWGQAVEIHDFGTAGHTLRVTRWFTALAESYGLNAEDLENGRKGAMLHDIGKLAVPVEILNKPGPLNEHEWLIMRQHPQFGINMLGAIEALRPALDIPHFHHERWDGLGYPEHLRGENIPLAARIFSIVDNFDALISKRPYKTGLSENDALDIIRSQRGKQLDPLIVDHFLANYETLKKQVEEVTDEENSGH